MKTFQNQLSGAGFICLSLFFLLSAFSAGAQNMSVNPNKINLNAEGGFTIASEENRPVFVPVSTSPSETGEVNSRVSRIDSSFAQVLEIGSHLTNESKQLTFSLNGVTRNGIVVRTSYTWSHVRDQSSLGGGGGGGGRGGGGGGGGGTTSGNPNVPEWGRSSLERRHSRCGLWRTHTPRGLRSTATRRGPLGAANHRQGQQPGQRSNHEHLLR